MKRVYKILTIAAVLMWGVGLQSCSNEVEEVSPRYPILFDCEDVTRTASANVDDLKANGFDVYAFYTVGENKFNFEKDVTFNTAQGLWGYEGLEYWWPGANYNFKAFYPKDTATVSNDTADQSYSISYSIDDPKDILVASATAEVPTDGFAPTNGSVVTLSFEHILTCVVFVVKPEVEGLVITGLNLNGIHSTGTYSNGTWNTTGSSSTDLETENYPNTLPTGALPLNQESDLTNGGLLLVPQETKSSVLTISTSDTTKTYQVTIPQITWNKGMKYTYTMTIKQDNITFDEPTVVEWDAKSATGSVIIK